ncbi:Uncharacterised protein [Candidatus Gugararchaeum adminiculabundum]|nr:Uncharacterised protein [Candidatus Gugararchaeum adminiculabundum]
MAISARQTPKDFVSSQKKTFPQDSLQPSSGIAGASFYGASKVSISLSAVPYLAAQWGLDQSEIKRMIDNKELELCMDFNGSYARLYSTQASPPPPVWLVSLTCLRSKVAFTDESSLLAKKAEPFLPIISCNPYENGKLFYFIPVDRLAISMLEFFDSSAHVVSVSDPGQIKELLGLPKKFDLEKAIRRGLLRVNLNLLEIYGKETEVGVILPREAAKLVGFNLCTFARRVEEESGVLLIKVDKPYGKNTAQRYVAANITALKAELQKPREPKKRRMARLFKRCQRTKHPNPGCFALGAI